MAEDYYAVLGISRDATDKDIRQVYRRLARKFHPDINPGDKNAERRFKVINEAYEVLGDSEKRRKYDRYGKNWKYADQFSQRHSSQGTPSGWQYQNFARGHDFSDTEGLGVGDLFASLFGTGRRRSQPATANRRRSNPEHKIEVTLEEAFHGTTRVVKIQGSNGRVRRLEVKIPAGVDTGSRVRISIGEGDLYLAVTVLPHGDFGRNGSSLSTEVSVPLVDFVLGGEVMVPTLSGRVLLKIPPETQNGRVFRLAGQGMPRQDNPSKRGDLNVIVRAVLPTDLNQHERQLFSDLRESRSDWSAEDATI